jgi:nitroreductase
LQLHIRYIVNHLLELAMKAPTGSNAQNWEFIVVKDREVVAKLGRLNRRAMNLVSPIYKRIIARRMDDQMLRIEKAVRWQADHFDDIPVVVVACLKGVVASSTLAVDGCEQRLRFHLSGGPELLAGGTGGRAGRDTNHHAAVEQAAGAARPGSAVECHSVRGNPSWLANR